MVIEIDIHQELPMLNDTVACIGYFDGVHLGHQQLLDMILKESHLSHVDPTVICFEPDPIQIITGNNPVHILNYRQRIVKLQEYGIEDIIVFRFDEDLMRMDGKDFIFNYLNRMNLLKLICGYDFSFGSMGKGNPELLRECGNFETVVIPEYAYEGEKVSSTRIKEALSRGDFSLAEALLGYEYYTDIKIVKCSKNGSKWLIEAIPSDPDVIIPNEGSYQGLDIKNDLLIFNSNIPYKTGDLIRIRYKDYERTV